MLFSQTAEYALRAITFLADHAESVQTSKQIAEGTKVPAGYLPKILQTLGRGGLVSGQRGIGGGFELTRSADQISVLDVINAVDPIRRILTCPLGLKGHGTTLCPMHRNLDDGLARIEETFAATTIHDLLHTPTTSPPMRELELPVAG